MTLHPDLERILTPLRPYARQALVRATELARSMHAEEVTPEHVLTQLLRDEMAGATRVILHAFADPETIAGELLALCPGIMVVGSGRTVPFSPRSVDALEEARRCASTEDERSVECRHVIDACLAALPEELARDLAERGLELPKTLTDSGPEDSAMLQEPLFKRFSKTAKIGLSHAARLAHRWSRASISPAHLVAGCTEAEESGGVDAVFSSGRLQTLIRDRDLDPTPLSGPAPGPSPELHDLLSGLREPAETFDVLDRFLQQGRVELRELLVRQKVTPALIERCRGSFGDP